MKWPGKLDESSLTELNEPSVIRFLGLASPSGKGVCSSPENDANYDCGDKEAHSVLLKALRRHSLTH